MIEQFSNQNAWPHTCETLILPPCANMITIIILTIIIITTITIIIISTSISLVSMDFLVPSFGSLFFLFMTMIVYNPLFS